jgi:hypothetical protein
MNFFKGKSANLLGLPSAFQGSWTFDRVTLSFSGNTAAYEKDYLEDYFLKSLVPFRFSLVLAMIFYGAFAFLDASSVPKLKELFWFIRFGVVFPVLISVFSLYF